MAERVDIGEYERLEVFHVGPVGWVVFDAEASTRASEVYVVKADASSAGAVRLTKDDGANSNYPDLAIGPGGQMALSWQDDRDGNVEVYLLTGRLGDLTGEIEGRRFGDDVAAIREHVRSLLPQGEADTAVGVAGTVTTIAALDLRLEEYDPDRIHGHAISRAAVTEQTARLAAMTVEERAEIIEPGRAPVIVAGAAILSEVLDFYGLDGVVASERDILHGAALAAAELPAPEEGAAPPGAYTC